MPNQDISNSQIIKGKYAIRELLGKTFTDHLLHSRGIIDESAKNEFLNPDYEKHVHDPFLLKDMHIVVERISSAISKNERILIYSDFDADGIPGAVVLHDFFKKISYDNFENFIPDRHVDGFGVHPYLLKNKFEESIQVGNPIKLVITIDCGITDVLAGECARELGFDLIITDHHTPSDVLPDVYAIINPKQPNCPYPEKMLCGAGVIFKVVQALLKEQSIKAVKDGVIKDGWEKWLLDIVGLATLSDMVPLTGENRVFAYFGLKVMKRTRRLGLIKLFKSLRMDVSHLTEEDITFMITPRINAASRMGNPMDAFLLLSTQDDNVAEEVVKHLNKLNDSRKTQVAHLVKSIKKEIEHRDFSSKPLIVIGNPDWKHPLLGLAATHVVREYGKPAYLWGRVEDLDGNTVIKGSCRAPDGMDAVSIMRAVPEGFFLNVGGHSAAGGFSISEKDIHNFEESLLNAHESLNKNKYESSLGSKAESSKVINPENRDNVIYIDKVVMTNEIGVSLWEQIERVAPFGESNQKPILMFKSVNVVDLKIFGKNKEHIELSLSHQDENGFNTKIVKAIQFFAANDQAVLDKIHIGGQIDLLANMEKSMFKKYPEYRLRVVEIL